MIKFEDLVFEGCKCSGFHADHTFDNGLTARVIKTGDAYTVLCVHEGLLASDKFPVKRSVDIDGVGEALTLIAALSG